MNKRMENLMWTAHRAEGSAAHDGNQTTGIFEDPRKEQEIPVTPEGIHIYNLGVAAGVKGLLGQLCEENYTLTDPDGHIVNKVDGNGDPQNFDEAFTQWLTVGFDK